MITIDIPGSWEGAAAFRPLNPALQESRALALSRLGTEAEPSPEGHLDCALVPWG